MPSFRGLPEDKKNQLVQFLASLRGNESGGNVNRSGPASDAGG
jgi:hypothetical protein